MSFGAPVAAILKTPSFRTIRRPPFTPPLDGDDNADCEELMVTLSFKTLALAALMLPSLALAQPAADQPPVDAPPPTDRLPPDGGRHGSGGGPQTLAEFQARYRERIMRADTDHDGRVSLAEWTAAHPPRDGGGGGGRGWGDPARQFQMLDVNRDGYVTPAEIDASSAARFARMDANHDGVLTPNERMSMRRGWGERDGGGGPQLQ